MKILAGVMFLALALGAVWEKVDVYRTGYAIEQLRIEKKQIQQEQRALELQLATVTSPEQIERVAAAQLGMVRARYDQVVVVGPTLKPEAGGIVRVSHTE